MSEEKNHVDELETYSRSASSRSPSASSITRLSEFPFGLDLNRSRRYRTDSVSLRAVGHSPPRASVEDINHEEAEEVSHNHVVNWLSSQPGQLTDAQEIAQSYRSQFDFPSMGRSGAAGVNASSTGCTTTKTERQTRMVNRLSDAEFSKTLATLDVTLKDIKRVEVRNGYRVLKSALPPSNQKRSKLSLLDQARQHILDLEEGNKELEARVAQREAEVEHLRNIKRSLSLSDNLDCGRLDVPISLPCSVPSNSSLLQNMGFHPTFTAIGAKSTKSELSALVPQLDNIPPC